jgi:hypothetical protein
MGYVVELFRCVIVEMMCITVEIKVEELTVCLCCYSQDEISFSIIYYNMSQTNTCTK